MAKVMIVDDEERMLHLIKLYLEPHGHECMTVQSGYQAIEQLEKKEVDLVLLDIMMPEMDGWETAKEMRGFSDVPIIMLTAKDQTSDMVKGLKIGADDYITKPFEEEVLLARINAVLRRTTKQGGKVEQDGLVWDEEQHKLSFNKQNIVLTPKEFEMIGLLLTNRKQVFSRERLIELIWGFDSETEGRTVDSHIRNMREKLRKVGFPVDDHLKTVWGVGYKWEE